MSNPHTHGGTDAPECTTCESQKEKSMNDENRNQRSIFERDGEDPNKLTYGPGGWVVYRYYMGRPMITALCASEDSARIEAERDRFSYIFVNYGESIESAIARQT